MVVEVTREQVLAYRVATQGFDRSVDDPAELAVLDLGIQDTPLGSARQALAARLPTPAGPDGIGPPREREADGAPEGRDPDRLLELAWSLRGAPHLHRPADLPRIAAGLWPRSEADALARLSGAGEQITAAGMPALTAFTEGVQAWRTAVTAPAEKGEASAAVTARAPAVLSAWCRGCGARHVYDQLFRITALPAGMRIAEPRPVTLAPIADWPDVAPSPAAATELVAAYLRLLGPATRGDVAAYLGTRPGEIEPVWPDGLVEVRVDGRRAWLPEPRVPALLAAEALPIVRLLPPSDPYLQARDRALVLPEKAQRAALWRGLLGRTGAVLVGAEIAGVWQARARGRNRLAVTVTAFRPWAPDTRATIEEEAGRLAAARGMAAAELHDE